MINASTYLVKRYLIVISIILSQGKYMFAQTKQPSLEQQDIKRPVILFVV